VTDLGSVASITATSETTGSVDADVTRHVKHSTLINVYKHRKTINPIIIT